MHAASPKVKPMEEKPRGNLDFVPEEKGEEEVAPPAAVPSIRTRNLNADTVNRSVWKRWFGCCVTRKPPELTPQAMDAVDMLRRTAGCGATLLMLATPCFLPCSQFPSGISPDFTTSLI